jgi:hypothetical protein
MLKGMMPEPTEHKHHCRNKQKQPKSKHVNTSLLALYPQSRLTLRREAEYYAGYIYHNFGSGQALKHAQHHGKDHEVVPQGHG